MTEQQKTILANFILAKKPATSTISKVYLYGSNQAEEINESKDLDILVISEDNSNLRSDLKFNKILLNATDKPFDNLSITVIKTSVWTRMLSTMNQFATSVMANKTDIIGGVS